MSYAVLILALAELALFVWAVRRWLGERDNIALMLMLFIVFPVMLDAFTVATGRWIGFGPTLETMNRIRFAWFVFSMPLMWPICAAILRNAGIGWLQNALLVPVLFVLAAVVGLYEAVQAWQNEFHPACVFDIQRYVFQVPAGQECMGSQAGDGTFGLPIVVPIGTLAVVLTGILLWWKCRWPWLGLICIVLVAVVGVPPSDYSILLSYPTDGLLTLTLVIAAVHFYARKRVSPGGLSVA